MHIARALAFVAAASAACVADGDLELATDESAVSVHQWTEDVRIADQHSQFQVGLSPLGNRLHMLAAHGSSGEIYWSHFDGQRWSGRTSLGQYADYGPALTTWNGQLVAVYHKRRENRLMMSMSDGATWSTPVTAGSTLGNDALRYAPAAASHAGRLYVAYCRRSGSTDTVRVERYEGNSRWTEVMAKPTHSECKHVALASIGDRLHVVYTVHYDSIAHKNWHMSGYAGTGEPGSEWTFTGSVSSMKSTKPPAMVTCGGMSHLLHGGFSNPNEIWWSFRDGNGWADDVRVPDQVSSGGAALGCFGGTRTIMVHNGGTTQLWWSEFGD